ncbi:kinase-regulated stress-responsive transcription factor skn7 [Rhizopus stolonifer]|uniref:Transcription factor n=1 Tax=Rhizopus stolonifer TaxID=4846 RepID=A0A367K4J1_RHIST|nr:kinase-regulated stress-responsive transcription factor skn7 [Rhizopus stolonifer]
MLENSAFIDIVRWDNSGTGFIINDANEFTKTILPQHFKHCNFASFVRQLNKYDFHKIRNNKQDQTWQFKHNFFKKDRKDLLEEIKRKISVKPREDRPVETNVNTISPEDQYLAKDLRHLIKRLQTQVNQMKQSHHELEVTVEHMHHRDRAVTSELGVFQQHLVKKDDLLKQCITLITSNNNNTKTSNPSSNNKNTLTHALDKLQQQQQYLATNKGKNKTIVAANWTTPPRVLLVDDDSVYRDVSGRMLTMMKCSVEFAKDGLEALDKLNLNKYDLILMDIMMPNMDGITTTRNIRRFDTVTPVVSMTSNFTQDDIMGYISIGMNDILPKPFSKNTLYDILEKHCAHLKLPTNYSATTPTGTTTPLLIEETSTSSTTTSPTTTPTHSANAVDYLTLNQHRKRPKFFHNPPSY